MKKNNLFLRLFSQTHKDDTETLSYLIKNIEKNISIYEKEMINNIININEINVREIMVPRVDVISIDRNSDLDEIIKVINESGHSRLPVYNENRDNIIGILHSKELLRFFNKKSSFSLTKIIKAPFFVPESKMIDDLLLELREKKVHLSIVVDEYGGMSGIVCLEDILEKIVGDIQDEFDNETDDIVKINDQMYMINARISLEELNKQLGINLDVDEIDTLAGLIYMKLGTIPVVNDKIDYENFIFTVEKITGHQIKKVKMEIKQQINEKA